MMVVIMMSRLFEDMLVAAAVVLQCVESSLANVIEGSA